MTECWFYELVFSVDGLEYEYDINASTGDVIKYEWEQSGQSGSAASTGQLIGKKRPNRSRYPVQE